jgi:hypothetical protein
MMPRSIAKVNAKSIDGYFGVGTSCFFIRGTILSDTPVDGDYPSLSFMRPGNVVEIASFDGVWAVATIQTRHGNRPGDNVIARLYLRDDDLKAHGVDCARIVNLNGLPFAFDVASLAAEGLFDHHDLEPYVPIEDDPDPPAEPSLPIAYREPEPPQRAAYVPPEPRIDATATEESHADAPETSFDLGSLIEMLRSGRSPFGKNPLLEIGASVAAVAVPVLLYMALAFLKNKPPDDEL